MFSRLLLYLDQVRYADSNNRRFARENQDFFQRLSDHVQVKGKRVLDVGCGKSFWLTLLLHSYGADVSGMDTEYVRPGMGLSKYLDIWRFNGLERVAKTLYWDIVYRRDYYRALDAVSSFPLNYEGLDLRLLVSPIYPYQDDEFDLVVSHEVFEHIEDMDGALAELRRVMKPGALTYIYVHLYTSLSGGHSIAWKYPDEKPSDTVPPWDHLRQNLYPEIPSWINRWREHQYRTAFNAAGFKIVDWFTYATEGEALLTPEIRAELADYAQEELLKKGFVVMAQNPC
jgi:SAM-dependent methyltransferase